MSKKWYGRTFGREKSRQTKPAQAGDVTITNGTVSVAECRKDGKTVCLDLTLTAVNAAASFTVIGTIPEEWAPDHEVGAVPNGSQLCWVTVNDAGEIKIYASPANASLVVRASLTWMLTR